MKLGLRYVYHRDLADLSRRCLISKTRSSPTYICDKMHATVRFPAASPVRRLGKLGAAYEPFSVSHAGVGCV